MMACLDGMEHVHAWRTQAEQLDLPDESGTAIARFITVDRQ